MELPHINWKYVGIGAGVLAFIWMVTRSSSTSSSNAIPGVSDWLAVNQQNTQANLAASQLQVQDNASVRNVQANAINMGGNIVAGHNAMMASIGSNYASVIADTNAHIASVVTNASNGVSNLALASENNTAALAGNISSNTTTLAGIGSNNTTTLASKAMDLSGIAQNNALKIKLAQIDSSTATALADYQLQMTQSKGYWNWKNTKTIEGGQNYNAMMAGITQGVVSTNQAAAQIVPAIVGAFL